MVVSKLNVVPSSSIDSMLFKFQLVQVVIVNIDVSIVKKKLNKPLTLQVVLLVKEGKGMVTKRRRRSWRRMDSAQQLPTRFFLEWISLFS